MLLNTVTNNQFRILKCWCRFANINIQSLTTNKMFQCRAMLRAIAHWDETSIASVIPLDGHSLHVNLPVWQTPSVICWIEGPVIFSTQSAEVRLSVSRGQSLFYFCITNVCFIPGILPALAVGFHHQHRFFLFVSQIWRTQKSSKILYKFKTWMECGGYWLIWNHISFEVFFSCPLDVLFGVIYANMQVATRWPPKPAPRMQESVRYEALKKL